MQALGVAETHFGLAGVDINVHLVRRQLQEEECGGVAAGHEQALVGFLQGMA
jgi:hypothetical protein